MNSSLRILKNKLSEKNMLKKLAFNAAPDNLGLGGAGKELLGIRGRDYIIERDISSGKITALLFSDRIGMYSGYQYLWRQESGQNVFLVVSSSDFNPEVGIVSAEQLNIRTGPGTSHSVERVMSRGNRVSIFEESRGWYRVSTSGWASGRYIDKTGRRAWPESGTVLRASSSDVYEGVFFQRLNNTIDDKVYEVTTLLESPGWQEELSQHGSWSVSDTGSDNLGLDPDSYDEDNEEAPLYDSSSGEVLRYGSRSPDVSILQRMLKSLGYNLGVTGEGNDGVDGHFGENTRSAVMEYQANLVSAGRIPSTYTDSRGRERSNIDGVVGPTTWSNLNSDFEPAAPEVRLEDMIEVVENFNDLPEPSVSFVELLSNSFPDYRISENTTGETIWSSMARSYRISDSRGMSVKPTTRPRYVEFKKKFADPIIFLIAEIPPVSMPIDGLQRSDETVYFIVPLPEGSAVGTYAPSSTDYYGRNLPLGSSGQCEANESGGIRANTLICFIMNKLFERGGFRTRRKIMRQTIESSEASISLEKLNIISKG